MKVNEAREALQLSLSQFFEEEGFLLRKTDFEYKQKQRDMIYIFRIYVHAMTDWFLIQPSVFVGCPKINKEFNRILSRKIEVNGTTTGFGIRNECVDRGSYSLEEHSQIPSIAESIMLDYRDFAVPFFQKISSIERLEIELNKKSEDGVLRPGSVSLACMGLIAARMVGREDITMLEKAYHDFMKEAQSPKLAEPIVTVFRKIEEERVANQAQLTTPLAAPPPREC